ncbi:MAG TPA: FecR domain-containing protein [Geobacteraceae bacterium]|nr:FecR domain-containing protein [Geobacteraceae bacterium]
MRITVLVLCALLFCAFTAKADDPGRSIGLVKKVTGDASIIRDGRQIAAQPGFSLQQGDVLTTGATGSMGIILRDDTMLSMGSSSEIHMEQFTFDPARQKLGMVARVTRGVIGYISGRIARLAPGSVRIETPVATLGVRGTHLYARIEP